MLKRLYFLLFSTLLLAACQSPAPEDDTTGEGRTTTAVDKGDPAPTITTPDEVEESTRSARDYVGIPGTAAPSEKQVDPDHRRYLYPGYRVEIQNRPPGERVTVYRPEPGGKPETLLASVEQEGAFFAGLYRSHLILHGGGEAGLHTLTIIDLTAPRQRQVRLKSPAHGERMSIVEDQLRFYVPKPGDPVECRTEGPGGKQAKGQRFEAFTYDFAGGEVKPTGEETCLYVSD